MADQFFKTAGNRSDDFYFIYSRNNQKRYYSKISGGPVAKSIIPENLLPGIQERKVDRDLEQSAKLIKQKEGYKNKIAILQAKIADIDKQLGILNKSDEELNKYWDDRRFQDHDKEVRQKRFTREEQERLRKLFTDMYRQTANLRIPDTAVFLISMGIHDKYDWKYWLLKNHPDKGGDTELCQRVIRAGRNLGY